MKENLIQQKSYDFALRMIDLYRKLCKANEYVLSKQLLRAGTSIGANVEEAQAAQNRADFISKMSKSKIQNPKLIIVFLFSLLLFTSPLHALTSNNIPLDSPVYLYMEKLSGFGLITSDVRGLKPFSKAEAARLTLEAEAALKAGSADAPAFALELISRLREYMPREIAHRENPASDLPFLNYNPVSSIRMRSVYLDGTPRDYNRTAWDSAHQRAFGFIGPDLRPLGDGGPVRVTGTEGTPLLENNNGTIHPDGLSGEIRWGAEAYMRDKATLLVEPSFLVTENETDLTLNRGYLKVGGGGLELELGRDENWFGQGYRGTTTLTSNAQNFDLVKLSSPEPVDDPFVRKWFGGLKYSLFVSRFDETDAGTSDHRQSWMVGFKLAVKPVEWYEIGANFVRQTGGPGFSGSSDSIFGGSDNDQSNTIAGVDMRFRIPSLRNTELHGEFSGEDNAGGVWPTVESYVAGFFIPCLTASCSDDFRFEYFYGSVMLYGDWQFPRGYVYHDMTPGHSQGGAGVQEFFTRYSHWFSPRNIVALEYFHTQRGVIGRMPGQEEEQKNAWRGSWRLPVYGEWNAEVMYGWEHINNFNLVPGEDQTNQIVTFDLTYRY